LNIALGHGQRLVAQNAPETVAPKARTTSLDPEQAPEIAQSLSTLRQTVEQLTAGRAQMARQNLAAR
jgi:hypothetical protein